MWACKSILPGFKLCSGGWRHSGLTNQHPMRNHWQLWVWRPATPAIDACCLGATMAAPQEGSIDAAMTSELWGVFHLKRSKEWHWGLSSIGEGVVALLTTDLPTRSADSSALLSVLSFQFVKQTIWCVRLVYLALELPWCFCFLSIYLPTLPWCFQSLLWLSSQSLCAESSCLLLLEAANIKNN